MGWWEQYDGIVIGDEFADLVGNHLEKMVKDLVETYPTISRDQVLHTISFCSGYFRHFDKGREFNVNSDKILCVMTINERRKWHNEHEIPPDMSKRIAPDTELENVFNPFTGKI